MIESPGLKPAKLLAVMVVMDVHLPKNIIKTAGASRRGFVDVLVIRLVTVLVSSIHCFCGEFALLALLRLGIAFRLRLGTVHFGLSLNSTISQGLVCVIISPSSSITSGALIAALAEAVLLWFASLRLQLAVGMLRPGDAWSLGIARNPVFLA